jgi:outer membrane protein TolC
MNFRLVFLRFAALGIGTLTATASSISDTAASASNEALPRPLILPAALVFAAEHNPGLRLVREQIKEQEGVLIQVKALRQPGLGLSGRYGETQDKLVQIPGNISESWQVKLTATKVLYAGGGIRAGIRGQNEQVEIAKLTYAIQEQNVLLAVRECFYTVLLSRELIAVREEAVGVLESMLSNAKHRREVGIGSQFDVIRAEATLANAQPSLIQARNNHRVAQDRLSRLLGAAAQNGERNDLDVQGEFSPGEKIAGLEEALANAQAQRDELKRQKHAIAAAEHGIAGSKAANHPTVSVQAGYEYTGDYTSSRIRNSIPGWSAGVQTDWAIFDGRARAGKMIQARSRSRQAHLAAEDLSLSIDLEVREAHAAVTEARQLLVAADKTVVEATDSLRLAKASEQEGMATQLDVLTAQAALTEARSTLSHARFACTVAEARLNRAMGVTGMALPPRQ